MKNLFVLCLVLISYGSYAQTADDVAGLKATYTADSTEFNTKSKVVKLIGHVSFKDERIDFEADNVVFNQESKQIIVTGVKKINFAGKVFVKDNSKPGTFKYTIGSDAIYFD